MSYNFRACMRALFLSATVLLSGCWLGEKSIPTNPALDLTTRSSGVGVTFLATKDTDLPYSAIGGVFDHHVKAGTLLKGTRVLQTPRTWDGAILWKLCGKVAEPGPQGELVIGDVRWTDGAIQGSYDGLSPLPSVFAPYMSLVNNHISMTAASESDLFRATEDRDWIIRYHAYKELIRRRNTTPELRAILEKGENDPVDMVRQTASGGAWHLYEEAEFMKNQNRPSIEP